MHIRTALPSGSSRKPNTIKPKISLTDSTLQEVQTSYQVPSMQLSGWPGSSSIAFPDTSMPSLMCQPDLTHFYFKNKCNLLLSFSARDQIDESD